MTPPSPAPVAGPGNAESRVGGVTTDGTEPGARESVCDCGDWQSQHVLGRGPCKVCRFGTPPPDGADGCQRYREAGGSDLDRHAAANAALAATFRRVFIR